MSIVELKEQFHTLIDEFYNERLLAKFYETMNSFKENDQDEDLWDMLTDTQKEDLEFAIKESENEKNWISNEDVKRESGKWLKK